MKTRLVWITPEAEQHIVYCARVSNPGNQDNPDIAKLIRYCYQHKHWSIFEMASACIEIETSRAISAQITRHRSFSFQEFSQRYSSPQEYEETTATRQTGKQVAETFCNPIITNEFRHIETENWNKSIAAYNRAIALGVSRETARALLPMGTMTRLYMAGSIRSWIHYLDVRNDSHTQYDHRMIARGIEALLAQELPIIAEVAGWM